MKPRFFKRRNNSAKINRCNLVGSFNGATLFQTWKYNSFYRSSLSAKGFNGATLFQTWKSLINPTERFVDFAASMEPRFFKRGNSGEDARFAFFSPASMEPRFFKRGNSMLSPHSIPSRMASMEPRFFKRGNRSAARSCCRP